MHHFFVLDRYAPVARSPSVKSRSADSILLAKLGYGLSRLQSMENRQNL